MTAASSATGHAEAGTLASAREGPTGAARAGTPAASPGMRAASPSLPSNARSSSISRGGAVSNTQGSQMKMKTSALNGSHTGAHLSAGSSLGNSALSHTGVNNSMFASAHLGSNTMPATPTSSLAQPSAIPSMVLDSIAASGAGSSMITILTISASAASAAASDLDSAWALASVGDGVAGGIPGGGIRRGGDRILSASDFSCIYV